MSNTDIYPTHVLHVRSVYYTCICYTCNTPETAHVYYRSYRSAISGTTSYVSRVKNATRMDGVYSNISLHCMFSIELQWNNA